MPKGKFQRRDLKKRCGAGAFLEPGALKYPIMAYRGACIPDCTGVEAAYKRSLQVASRAQRKGQSALARRNKRIAAKAKALGKRAACHWARGD